MTGKHDLIKATHSTARTIQKLTNNRYTVGNLKNASGENTNVIGLFRAKSNDLPTMHEYVPTGECLVKATFNRSLGAHYFNKQAVERFIGVEIK